MISFVKIVLFLFTDDLTVIIVTRKMLIFELNQEKLTVGIVNKNVKNCANMETADAIRRNVVLFSNSPKTVHTLLNMQVHWRSLKCTSEYFKRFYSRVPQFILRNLKFISGLNYLGISIMLFGYLDANLIPYKIICCQNNEPGDCDTSRWDEGNKTDVPKDIEVSWSSVCGIGCSWSTWFSACCWVCLLRLSHQLITMEKQQKIPRC